MSQHHQQSLSVSSETIFQIRSFVRKRCPAASVEISVYDNDAKINTNTDELEKNKNKKHKHTAL